MRATSRRRAMAEINVTPLVDVMLVLLIIFMVAAPMMEQGIDVALPPAATGQKSPASAVSITLTREHLIYFDGEAVSMEELRGALAGLKDKPPVLIRSDRGAYVSKLVDLWDLCRDAGFREIRIATITE